MSFSKLEATALTKFVVQVAAKERYIEIKRQLLCDHLSFVPYAAFQRLSGTNRAGIEPKNIYDFLKDNGSNPSTRNCELVIRHYDFDRDGVLCYKEFLELILPTENTAARYFITQKDDYEIIESNYIDAETEAALASLLFEEAYFYDHLGSSANQLTIQKIDTRRILSMLGSSNKLDYTALTHFFNEIGVKPYDAEIISFLRRIDLNADGLITYREIEDFLHRFELVSAQRHSNDDSKESPRKPNTKALTQNKNPNIISLGELPTKIASPQKKQVRLVEVMERPNIGHHDKSFSSPGSAIENTTKTLVDSVISHDPLERIITTEENIEYRNYNRSCSSSRSNSPKPYREYSPERGDNRLVYGVERSQYSRDYIPFERRKNHYPCYGREIDYERNYRQYNLGYEMYPNPRETFNRSPYRENKYRRSRSPQKGLYSQRSKNLVSSKKAESKSPIREVTEVQNSGPMRSGSHALSRSPSLKSSKKEDSLRRQESKGSSLRTSSKVSSKKEDPKCSKIESNDTEEGTKIIQDIEGKLNPGLGCNKRAVISSDEDRARDKGLDTQESNLFKFSRKKVERELVQYLQLIIKYEQQVNAHKFHLSMKSEFDIERLAELIDTRKSPNKRFTFEDFYKFLKNNHSIKVSEKSLDRLYNEIHSNRNCLLGKEELKEILAPNQKGRASIMGTLREGKKFNAEERTIMQCLIDTFDYIFQLLSTKKKFSKALKEHEIDLSDLFDMIDIDEKGYLDITALTRLFGGIEDCKGELEEFMISVDIHGNGRADFKNFFLYFN